MARSSPAAAPRAVAAAAAAALAVTLALALAAAPADARPRGAKNPIVVLQTSAGVITVEIFASRVPATAKNFLTYVEEGFYDNTLVHRIVPGFVVQAGGYDRELVPKLVYPPIENEGKKSPRNTKGTLAMAHTLDDPDSATSQFFINLRDNKTLDAHRRGTGYVVFGQVIDGMDVVEALGKVATEAKDDHSHVPVEPVVLETARRTR